MRAPAVGRTTAAWFAGALLGLYVPFLDKAFHIDDPAFLNFARLLDWNPLRGDPAGIPYPYMGESQRFLIQNGTNPLLVPYLLKAAVALFGETERALHAVFLVFPLIAVWGLAQLQRSLFPASRTPPAVVATLLIASPAFLVSSHSLMTDTAAVSLLLAAAGLAARAADLGCRKRLYASAVLMTLAVFAKYPLAGLAPLLPGLAWLKRRLDAHSLAAAAIPLVACAGWFLAVHLSFGALPLIADSTGQAAARQEVARGLETANLLAKSIAIPGHLGAALLAPLALALHRRPASRAPAAAVVGATLAVSLGVAWLRPAFVYLDGWSVASLLGLGAVGGLGLSVLAVAATPAPESQRSTERSAAVLLLGWVAVVIGYNLFLPFAASRYLLPAVPPLLLLLVNGVPWPVDGRLRLASAGVLVMAVGWGATAAWSDLQLAGSYRSFAQEVRTFRANRGDRVDVWYVGEWGMRHYMDAAGARYLLRSSNEPRPGDYVVIPEMPRFWSPSPALLARMRPYAEREYRQAFPLRLFNRRSHAGFYAHHWGLLPLALSREPDEVFQVWQVVR